MSTPKFGIKSLVIDGKRHLCKGEVEYNTGAPKREPVNGADQFHGLKYSGQHAFIKGSLTDPGDLNVSDIVGLTDVTVTANLVNGKAVTGTLSNVSEGTMKTGEGELEFEFVGAKVQEL